MTTQTQDDQTHRAISDAHDNDIIVATREIFLVSIDEEDGESVVDARMALRFVKNLHILQSINNDPIIIHQYTIGGSWESGMMIYDAIKHSTTPFIFITHGCAASMGSIIPQSAYKKGLRLSMPNCVWIVHEGQQSMSGTCRQFQSFYEYNRTIKTQMYNIYADVCKSSGLFFDDMSRAKTKSYIRRKLESKEDWWMNAEEATSFGLIDGVLGSRKYPDISKIKKTLV